MFFNWILNGSLKYFALLWFLVLKSMIFVSQSSLKKLLQRTIIILLYASQKNKTSVYSLFVKRN